MRRDERRTFGLESEARKQRIGVRTDEELESIAICRAAFCNTKAATLRTGLSQKSAQRAKVVAVECGQQAGELVVQEWLATPAKFKIYKRSCDETPMHARDGNNVIAPTRVLNSRLHLSHGNNAHDACGTRVIALGGELDEMDAVGLLECLERSLPSARLEELKKASEDPDCYFFVIFQLQDQCTALSCADRLLQNGAPRDPKGSNTVAGPGGSQGVGRGL